MNRFLLISTMLGFLIMVPSLVNAQIKIIFDTDFGADADDLGALVMLHGFIETKECDLLAIMVWSTEASVIPAIDAVNRDYGHPDIPIGIRSGGAFVSDWNHSKAIADKLPNNLTNEEVPDATFLYRKILAENGDKSIVLVTVGPLMNIKNLLESEADQYSELTGKELIHRKVNKMVVMGGQYPEGNKEWNFWGDMAGVTKFVFDNIDLPVVFSGYEIGDAIKTGAVFNDIDPNSPLYLGFKHFSQYAPWMKDSYSGKISNNSTFDQTAVLYAVQGGVGVYWEKVDSGRNEIDDEGNNRWIEGPKNNHSYLRLIVKPEKMARLIESLMLYDLKKP